MDVLCSLGQSIASSRLNLYATASCPPAGQKQGQLFASSWLLQAIPARIYFKLKLLTAFLLTAEGSGAHQNLATRKTRPLAAFSFHLLQAASLACTRLFAQNVQMYSRSSAIHLDSAYPRFFETFR